MDTWYLQFFFQPTTVKEFCEKTKGVDARSWSRLIVREFLESGYIQRTEKGRKFVVTQTGRLVYRNYFRC